MTGPVFRYQVYEYITLHTRGDRLPTVWLNREEYSKLFAEVPIWDRLATNNLQYRGFNLYGADCFFHPDAPSILEKPRPWLVYKRIKKT
jgi:hypothetical protein